MSIPVKVGDGIPLRLQLSDEDSGAFPQAVLRDPTGSELPGSPVDLGHEGDGLYTNNAVSFPDEEFIIAQYKVYQNGGHTIRHECHPDTIEETFVRNIEEEAKTVRVPSGGLIIDVRDSNPVEIEVSSNDKEVFIDSPEESEVDIESTQVTTVIESDNIELDVEG